MWLNRLELIVEDLNKLKNQCVVIIGLGGVGGSALEAIVRSGVNNIILIDNDIIDVTNLNRQILSLRSNIGKYKVDVAYDRIKDINPDCNVIKLNIFLDESNILELFKYDIDYVIDACDTVDTKVLLIKECLNRNIKIISSMGTANKFNPLKLEIIDISKTNYDPLAKILRKKLKNIGIKNTMVVSSNEKPINKKELGSNSLVPNTSGILCASYVINDILKNGV